MDNMIGLSDAGKEPETVGLKNFLNVYGFDIQDHIRYVQKQFRNIYVYKKEKNNGWKSRKHNSVNVKIVESGTQVRFEEFHEEAVFTLFIGYADVVNVAKELEMDLFDAFCKLVSHEYLHFLLDHLTEDFAKFMHYFVRKSTNPRYYWNHTDDRDPIFTCKDETPGNDNYDPIMANMAEDMYINWMIDMKGYGLRAKEFGLPEGLTEVHYYSIIYHLLNSYPAGEVKTQWFQSKGLDTYLSEHYMPFRELVLKQYLFCCAREGAVSKEMLKAHGFEVIEAQGGQNSMDIESQIGKVNYESDNEAREEEKRNNAINRAQGNVPAGAQKMHAAKSGIWKSFYDLLRELERDHQKQKLSKVDKVQNWTKFNNRKDGYGMMYPGKSEVRGAMERKIMDSTVLFVDVSGSMAEVIEPLFTFCYLALQKCELDLVFYDTEIKAIFSNENVLKLEPFVCGGTDCYAAVKQYEAQKRRPTKVYVLSDCYDSTLHALRQDYGNESTSIWKITRTRLKKWEG